MASVYPFEARADHFIRAERLLSPEEVDDIWRNAPTELIRFQDAAALIPVTERPTMEEWIADFNAGRLAAG
ncbi:hypothetical protein FHS96_005187 [Sphingomonas zeicaulis]